MLFEGKFKKGINYSILHVASNIIDPRYQGRDLEEGEFTNGVEYMCKMVKVLQIVEENELLQNLSRYRNRLRENLASKPSCLDKNIMEKVEFIAFNSRSLK